MKNDISGYKGTINHLFYQKDENGEDKLVDKRSVSNHALHAHGNFMANLVGSMSDTDRDMYRVAYLLLGTAGHDGAGDKKVIDTENRIQLYSQDVADKVMYLTEIKSFSVVDNVLTMSFTLDYNEANDGVDPVNLDIDYDESALLINNTSGTKADAVIDVDQPAVLNLADNLVSGTVPDKLFAMKTHGYRSKNNEVKIVIEWVMEFPIASI